MERLRQRTKTIYYEQYREERLRDMGIVGADASEQTLRWDADDFSFSDPTFHPL